MLKNTLCAAIVALSVPTSAFAVACDKYYVGVDVQGLKLKPEFVQKQNDTKWGLSGFVGYRWKIPALELGITAIQSSNYNIATTNSSGVSYNGDADLKAYNIYLDALFYKGIAEKLELKGLVGLGYLWTKSNLSVTGSNNSKYSLEETAINVGLRLGAGLQYNFNNHLNSSLMYKYQMTSKSFNDMQVLALSLAYVF